jgi:hypothetical protein
MKILLSTFILLLVGCNDQISDNLSSTSSSSSSSSSSTSYDEKFLVDVTSDSYLSYYLHEIGQTTEGCSIDGPFDASSPKTKDCFVEAEEFSLYFNGIKMILAAGENTCDYMAYFPYHFYQWRPGSNNIGTRTATQVNCPDACVADCNLAFANLLATTGGTYYSNDGNTTFDQDGTKISANSCFFNHTSNDGPNCDEGTLTVTTADFDEAAACAQTNTTTEVDCGGKHRACINGPIRETAILSASDIEDNNFRYVVMDTENNEASKEYTITPPYENKYRSNVYIANYTKQCGAGVAAPYYDPDTIDSYTSAAALFAGGFENENPFFVEGGTNPHYTFYCLNKSFEVKARIRVMIRDWDEEFPATATFQTEILDPGTGVVGTGTYMDDPAGSETITSPISPLEDFYDWDEDTTNRLNLDNDGAGGLNACTATNSNGYFPEGDL